MKITRSYKIRILILVAALSIGLGCVSPVSAQVRSYILDSDRKGLTDLGTLGGGSSIARGINDAGQVVGESETAAGDRRAFITGPGGVGMTDLGTLGGDVGTAWGINDAGQVVGESYLAGGGYHAFITGPNGVGMTDLGALGGADGLSTAYDINDAGQVVGSSNTPFDVHAFITGPNGEGMTDLNSLVSLPAGHVLTEARAINNLGQVIVVGIVPEPATYALMLAGLILVGFMARPKRLLA